MTPTDGIYIEAADDEGNLPTWEWAEQTAKEVVALRAELAAMFVIIEGAYKDCLPAAGDDLDTVGKWESRRDFIRFKLRQLLDEKTPHATNAAARMRLLERISTKAGALLSAPPGKPHEEYKAWSELWDAWDEFVQFEVKGQIV